jgi:tetratricopeptide (TPR) repeat protein
MNKLLSTISIFALVFLFSGCDKYLNLQDAEHVGENIALNSDENVKSVLQGAYSQFALPSIYGGNLLRNAELLGGNGEIQWVGTYIDPRQIFSKTMIATNSEAEVQWRDSYATINTTNNILSALAVVKEADRDRVKGEALFLRGLMYFDLVRFFAKQYRFGVVNDQLGVPIILTPTHGIVAGSNVARNTVEEVYNQTIADLELAASLLPLDNDVYASKGAANALLARLYLQKGDYAKARDRANTVIGSGTYSLVPVYSDEFDNSSNTLEDIFATQITPQDRLSSMTEFFSVPDFGGRGDIEILQAHLNLYPAGDQRLALFTNRDDAMRTDKWNNQYGIINLIRLAEMYLIRAECNIRLSTAIGDTPLNDYNAVHTRAGLTAAGSVVLNDILLERRLELAFEGFRIHDQRRLQQNVGTYNYNDDKLVFPIPEREIQANPNLAPNPGY